MSITALDRSGAHAAGADVLIEVLRSEGVHYIFGNPDTSCRDGRTCRCSRYPLHLGATGGAASCNGRRLCAGGWLGGINLHTAGGLGHGFGNLLNAGVSGTPLEATAGQQGLPPHPHRPPLYGDLVSIAAPAVKWARSACQPDFDFVCRALHDSQTAPNRGAVFLRFPMDVMEE